MAKPSKFAHIVYRTRRFDEMVDWYGGGFNYYVWGQSLKLSAEFNHTKFDKGSHKDFNTVVTQLQLVF